MLHVNMYQNLQVVIWIATKYSDILGPVKLIEMFESFKTFKGESWLFSNTLMLMSVITRTILLSWINCQPEWRPQSSLQVYTSHHLHRPDLWSWAHLLWEQPLQPLRKSRTSSKKPSYQISFLLSLSVIDLILSTILSFTFIKMVLPSSLKSTSSELILSGLHRLLVVLLMLTVMNYHQRITCFCDWKFSCWQNCPWSWTQE